MTTVVRIAQWLGGFILAAHGLVFMIFLTGAPAYPEGRLEWSGEAAMSVTGAEGIGRLATVLSIGAFVVSGVGLAFFPRSTWWAWCCVGAGAISLAALWWMWPGLLPSPGTYWRGFVLSGIAVVAGVAAVWVKWAR